jgi:hypothetical protein
MALAALGRYQADVTASLPNGFVTHTAQCFGQVGPRQISRKSHVAREIKLQQGVWSTRQHFFTHKMETDDFWGFTLVEMAMDGVPHVAAKLLQRFGFSKDGMTKSAGCITAFGRLLDKEYQFVHFVRANRPLMFSKISAIRRSLSRIH